MAKFHPMEYEWEWCALLPNLLPPHDSQSCPPCYLPIQQLNTKDFKVLGEAGATWWGRLGLWITPGKPPAAQKHPYWIVVCVRNRLRFWNLFVTVLPNAVSFPARCLRSIWVKSWPVLGRLWAWSRLFLTYSYQIWWDFQCILVSNLVLNTSQLLLGGVALPICASLASFGSWFLGKEALPTDLPNPWDCAMAPAILDFLKSYLHSYLVPDPLPISSYLILFDFRVNA